MPNTNKPYITLGEFAKARAAEFPNNVMMQMREKRAERYRKYSYREFDEMSDFLAAGLRKLGFKRQKSKMALIGPNCPEWVIYYFAIIKLGIIAVPLDNQLKEHEIRFLLNDAEVEGIFTFDNHLDEIVSLFTEGKLSKKCKYVFYDNAQTGYESDVFPLQKLIEIGREEISRKPLKMTKETEDIASIIYTSGTTGSSKGVVLTHQNFIANALSCAKMFDLQRGREIFLSMLPLHHSYEFTAGLLTAMNTCSTITFARSLKSRDLLADIQETGVSVMNGVPLVYEKILMGILNKVKKSALLKKTLFRLFFNTAKLSDNVIDSIIFDLDNEGLSRKERHLKQRLGKVLFKSMREQAGLDKIRFMVAGGAKLPVEIERGFHALGMPLFQGYGLTETAPILATNGHFHYKMGATGFPIEGVELRIADPNENDVGEIQARGDNVMKGYYKRADLDKEIFTKDGWFRTGDLGYIDKDGFLFVTGRCKNLIVTRGGKNVYPEEIESKLNLSLLILESLVLNRPHPDQGGDDIHAIIVPNYDYLESDYQSHKKLTKEFIHSLIKQEVLNINNELAPYKRIKSFEIRDEEFPKTTTRKIKRYLFHESQENLK